MREVKWIRGDGMEVLAINHPGMGLEIVAVRNPDTGEELAREDKMNTAEFLNLAEGDIIRHVNGSQSYIVHANYRSGGVLIVRSRLIHNPSEWSLIFKAHQAKPEEEA